MPNKTQREELLKRIGMHKEDTEFNRRAAAYADSATKQASTAKHREKTTPKLNEERLSHD